ncbi:hypothetical protein B0H15DRAFT_780321 [Mycena belliarum]|uniref:Alpha-type protein kinase domain-containing protein n=1 Tax=Mycena belliarum TaxID=1033014 RepID=A0AAD6XUR1_9AGAR|nr:hypothetical protein B0H15DRAFT_780321 [Mycena belliae]
MDILAFDQHDKWKRFGLWLHVGLDPFPGRIAWLKIWWMNRNPKLITSYYINACRLIGGTQFTFLLDSNTLCRLVFRWLAIPWLQRELDAWVQRYNGTARRSDKHKILPQGIPDLIASKPEQFGTKDYKVLVTPDLFDEMETTWAPPDDPVFKLTPDTFDEQATFLYAAIGSPDVNHDSLWIVFSQLLNAFLDLPAIADAAFEEAVANTDDHFEVPDMELLANQRELRHGDAIVGSHGYMGGLDEPPVDEDEDEDEDEVESNVDPREYAQQVDHHCDFTPLTEKTCGRCKAVPNEGEEFTFLHSHSGNQAGRYVCPTCYSHYMNKQGTLTSLRRTTLAGTRLYSCVASTVLIFPPITEKSVSIQRIGPNSLLAQSSSQAAGGRMLMPPPIGFPLSNLSNGHSHGPGVFVAYYASNSVGYTPNHLTHATEQQRRAAQAYAGHGGLVVSIEVRAAIMPIQRTTCKLVGDVLEVIDDVPVHIGGTALKALCFNAMIPAWNRYTDSFPLTIDDVKMRDEKWAALVNRDPDIDIIRSKFFHAAKKTGGAPQFRTKKQVINMHIPNDIYDRMAARKDAVLEQANFDQMIQSIPSTSSPGTLEHMIACPPKPKQTRGKKEVIISLTRASLLTVIHVDTPDDLSQSEEPLFNPLPDSESSVNEGPKRSASPSSLLRTPPSKKICLPQSPESPQMNRLQFANVLKKQVHGTRNDFGAFYKNKIFNVIVYRMKKFTKMNDLLTTTSNWQTLCDDPVSATLIINVDPKYHQTGAFKMARSGETNPALFSDRSNFDVCVKQTYYMSKDLKIAGSSITTGYPIAQDYHSQASKSSCIRVPQLIVPKAKLLSMEVRCLGWGNVLLFMVYDFIRRSIREMDVPPPFAIPQMRFVNAALASTQDVAGDSRDLFLVEERIREDTEGKFRKYINNRAAIPTQFQNAGDNERAAFLAFTQHVQYYMTFKTVFVSDYQGTSLSSSLRAP